MIKKVFFAQWLGGFTSPLLVVRPLNKRFFYVFLPLHSLYRPAVWVSSKSKFDFLWPMKGHHADYEFFNLQLCSLMVFYQYTIRESHNVLLPIDPLYTKKGDLYNVQSWAEHVSEINMQVPQQRHRVTPRSHAWWCYRGTTPCWRCWWTSMSIRDMFRFAVAYIYS